MSANTYLLFLSPECRSKLPLGLAKLFATDEVLDDETIERVTLRYEKYRQSMKVVVTSAKPISKVEVDER